MTTTPKGILDMDGVPPSGLEIDEAVDTEIADEWEVHKRFEATAAPHIERAAMRRATRLYPDANSQETAFARACREDAAVRELMVEHARFGHLDPGEWLKKRKEGRREAARSRSAMVGRTRRGNGRD